MFILLIMIMMQKLVLIRVVSDIDIDNDNYDGSDDDHNSVSRYFKVIFYLLDLDLLRFVVSNLLQNNDDDAPPRKRRRICFHVIDSGCESLEEIIIID